MEASMIEDMCRTVAQAVWSIKGKGSEAASAACDEWLAKNPDFPREHWGWLEHCFENESPDVAARHVLDVFR